MNFKKILAILVIATIATACFVCPVAAQETAELPILISPNPNASTQPAEEVPVAFSDVAEDAPYRNAIIKLVQNGVLNGYPDGTFRPAGNLTRAEMCKMINLTFGYTDIEGAAGFPDLVEDEWYIPYVLAAQKAGYITGDAAGTFRPGDNISRQEVCVILCRIIKPYDLPIPVTINDKIDDWARPYVETIVKNGLMPLEEGGNFRATEAIKRSELASTVAPHSNVKVEDIKCTVTFICGEEVFTEQVVIGKAFETLPVPKTSAPEGFEFAGWKTKPESTVIIKNDKQFFADTTLYAHFAVAQHSVKFMAGTAVIAERTVKHGELVSAPASPEMEGVEFEGWAVEGTSTVINLASYAITKDTVFVAVFAKEESSGGGGGGGSGGGGGGAGGPIIVNYKVVFMSGGESVSEQTVKKNEFATAPTAPTLENFEFVGWSLTENGAIVSVGGYTITSETTFYAVFKAKELPKATYKVSFMSAGRKVAEQTVTENEYAVAPGNPTLANHEFTGWSLTENGAIVSVAEYAITAETTFYAVFKVKETPDEPDKPELKTYTVVFMSNGSKIAEITVNEGGFATAPRNPTLDNHDFLGWSLTENGTVISAEEYAINAETTFYAVFKRIIIKYAVSFISDGKTVSEQEIEENKFAVAPKNPELANHTFIGWGLTKNGNIVSVGNYAIVSETTFYAIFERNPIKYTVNFVSDGKTVSEQEIEENKFAVAPKNPELANHIFIGWSLAENGNTVSVGSYAITSETTFYAVFQRIILKFNVEFIADGEVVSTQQVKENEYASEPSEPYLEDHEFIGWSLTENGDIVSVEDYEITEETTFYAVFEYVLPPQNPNDDEVIEQLRNASAEFYDIRLWEYDEGTNEYKILTLVIDTIDSVVEEAESGIYVNAAHVKSNYGGVIDDIKDLIRHPDTSKTFVSDMTQIEPDTFAVLTEYFLTQEELDRLEQEIQ